MRHDDAPGRFWVNWLESQQALAFTFRILEVLEQHLGIGGVEVVAGVFFLGLAEDIAIGQRDRGLRVVEGHVHDVIDAEDIHRQPLKAIGQLA